MSWVLDAERAYVATATTRAPLVRDADRARALAAAGAVASRYLAVGTPRSFGLVVDAASEAAGALSLEAHRTWFAPTDVRSTLTGATLAAVLACDIVCVHAACEIEPRMLRRGTHVNVLHPLDLGEELQRIAQVTHEEPGLCELAAGFVDGRQLDEITIFVAARVQGR